MRTTFAPARCPQCAQLIERTDRSCHFIWHDDASGWPCPASGMKYAADRTKDCLAIANRIKAHGWVSKEDAAPRCRKRCFASEEEAEAQAFSLTRANLTRIRASGRTAARVYRCGECQTWHITSLPFN